MLDELSNQLVLLLLPFFINPVYAILSFFSIFSISYLLMATLIFFLQEMFKWNNYPIPEERQIKREVIYSLFNIGLLSGVFAILWYGFSSGLMEVYYCESETIWYELLLLIILVEIYYSLIHRLMHRPWLYEKIHSVHHESQTASPFSAYAYHPIEILILAVPLPIAMLLYDFSFYVLMFYPIWYMVVNILAHSDIKWLWFSRDNQLHHKGQTVSYLLFFSFIDRIRK